MSRRCSTAWRCGFDCGCRRATREMPLKKPSTAAAPRNRRASAPRRANISELEREPCRPRVRADMQRVLLGEAVEREPVGLEEQIRAVDPGRVVHVARGAVVERIERERDAGGDVRAPARAFA